MSRIVVISPRRRRAPASAWLAAAIVLLVCPRRSAASTGYSECDPRAAEEIDRVFQSEKFDSGSELDPSTLREIVEEVTDVIKRTVGCEDARVVDLATTLARATAGIVRTDLEAALDGGRITEADRHQLVEALGEFKIVVDQQLAAHGDEELRRRSDALAVVVARLVALDEPPEPPPSDPEQQPGQEGAGASAAGAEPGVEGPPEGATVDVPTERRLRPMAAAGVALMAVGGSGLAAAVVLGAMTSRKKQNFIDTNCTRAACADEYAEGLRYQNANLSLYVIGGAVLGAGIGLVAHDARRRGDKGSTKAARATREKQRASIGVAPYVGGGGYGVTGSLRF